MIHQIVHMPVVEKGRNHYVPVPVPTPPHVVYKTHVVQLPPKIVYQHDETNYDCHAGYSNWYFGWSDRKKSWCCDRRSMGCPGTWHGSYHIHTHVMAHGVGHAQGRIYDCDAGFSRWMTGWSDSKKDWCCNHQSRGCVKFHCTAGGVAQQRVGCWTFSFLPSRLSLLGAFLLFHYATLHSGEICVQTMRIWPRKIPGLPTSGLGRLAQAMVCLLFM